MEEVTYTQPVDPPVEEVPDAALLLGERQVLQEGTPGLEERTDRVTCTQGVEEARETMSVNRLTQPTPTQVAVGTAQGAEGAQGRFLWPLEGRISSPFRGPGPLRVHQPAPGHRHRRPHRDPHHRRRPGHGDLVRPPGEPMETW